MTVIDNIGVTEVDLGLLESRVTKIRSGEAIGCEMKPFTGVITVKLTASKKSLTVDLAQDNDAYSCINNAKLSNLASEGYLGITAANHDKSTVDINVLRIQVWDL